MAEVNLLARLPKSKRNIEKRKEAQTPENIVISRQYGEQYFDGPREVGYGGYRYDGRWIPIAEDIVAHAVFAKLLAVKLGGAPGFGGIQPAGQIHEAHSRLARLLEDAQHRLLPAGFVLEFGGLVSLLVLRIQVV